MKKNGKIFLSISVAIIVIISVLLLVLTLSLTEDPVNSTPEKNLVFLL